MLLSGYDEFASEIFSRKSFFLIGANIKYGRALGVSSRHIPEKQSENWLMSIYDDKKF